MDQNYKQLSFRDAVAFIQKYRWLTECVVDFHVNEIKLPSEFLELSTKSHQELIDLTQCNAFNYRLNSTLKEFVNDCHRFKLSRRLPKSQKEAPKLTNALAQGLNPKKQLEVRALAAYIDNLSQSHGINQIVDMGSGQGYLDTSLVFQYGYNVIGIDCNSIQTCGAQKQAKRIETTDHIGNGSLVHINRFIEPKETFREITRGLVISDKIADAKWLICGLHSCGNLSVSCINQFINGDAKVMAVVGCCYNLINPSTFPLSNHIKATGITLGLPQFMLACQVTSRWDTSVSTIFKRHHYRALLQLILKDLKLLRLDGTRVGKIHKGCGFVEYCTIAFKNLKIEYPQLGLNLQVLLDYESRFANREKEVAIYWTLRSMMGGVVESLILTDRALYLEEAKVCSSIILEPIFDEVTSPRNVILVAIKKK